MSNFWEKSPLWQRTQELREEFDAAVKAEDKAGEMVLACVRSEIDTPRNAQWLEARRGYLDAWAACLESGSRWDDARKAFRASPVGQARDRYWADPIALDSAAYAPTETDKVTA